MAVWQACVKRCSPTSHEHGILRSRQGGGLLAAWLSAPGSPSARLVSGAITSYAIPCVGRAYALAVSLCYRELEAEAEDRHGRIGHAMRPWTTTQRQHESPERDYAQRQQFCAYDNTHRKSFSSMHCSR